MKEWLNRINYGVFALAILLLLAALFLTMSTPSDLESAARPPLKPLAGSSFQHPQKAYDLIGENVLQLKTEPVGLQLPDLRKSLAYYGRNGRPDADPNSTMMNFGFLGTPGAVGVTPYTSTYLVYDKKQSPPRYQFSPQNAETALWIEVQPDGNQAQVNVRMKDDSGQLITTPSANARFTIQEKPFVRTDSGAWEIGKYRVDGTLLARQRARWFGQDRFFERHGGPEYQQFADKQRIEFGEAAAAYTVHLSAGDVLVWDNERWSVAEPGLQTLGKPILIVKKVDERLINFELWDPEGKIKVVLNLLKGNEPAPSGNILQSFKFVGSRTRSQFTFEINKQRIMLSPHDWLLQTDKGWKKLKSLEEIDAYVEGKATGLLFVFDGVEKRDDRQVLLGTLFNKSRSDFQKIEMVMETGAGLTPAAPGITAPTQTAPTFQAPQPPQIPPLQARANLGERPLELHPHTRTDIREYQTKSR